MLIAFSLIVFAASLGLWRAFAQVLRDVPNCNEDFAFF